MSDHATPARSAVAVKDSDRLPRRIMMSVDAVGGIWRYAMDLAGAMRGADVDTVFVGFGPQPSTEQRCEAGRIGELEWIDVPLDWMVDDEAGLDAISDRLAEIADKYPVDLLHLNLPSQAAGIKLNKPLVVASHSCVATWFRAVRGCDLPAHWLWQKRRNRQGFDRADIVIAPSRSHAAALARCYGPIANLKVVPNASRSSCRACTKEHFAFAAGRWWDEGKNGALLDRAAARIRWPVIMAGACEGPNGERLVIEHATHLGELTHDRTMALMSSAAIVVSPSIYEPFGLAPLEAARTGATLVLADIDTYRELWDGAALFVDPNDPAALSDTVLRLAKDAGCRAQLARRAFLRASDFTLEAQCGAVLDAYGQAMHGSSRLTAAE